MKNKMKLLLIFFSIITLSVISNAQPNELFLKEKKYYSDIFDKTDIAKLDAAIEYNKQGEKYRKKSDENFAKAKKFFEMQDLPIAQSKIKKYERKELKYLKKASKYKLKALEYSFESNEMIKGVYSDNLAKIKLKDNKTLFDSLDRFQSIYIDSFILAKSQTTNNDIDKALNWGDAYYFENQALLYMEYKFAVSKNDKKIISQLNKKIEPVKKNEDDTTKTGKKEPKWVMSKDKYIYLTKNEKIDEILSYSQSEEELLLKYFQLGKNGFLNLYKGEELNEKIEDYDKKIDKAQDDFMKKRELIAEKREVTNEQIIYKIDGIQQYINANKNFYNCRKNHYYDFAPDDSTTNDFILAEMYFQKAEIYYYDCDRFIELATKKGAEEKFYSYIFANDQLKTALEYQENGLNIQFGVDTNIVTPIHKPDTAVVNKIIGKNKDKKENKDKDKDKENKDKDKDKDKDKNKDKNKDKDKVKQPVVAKNTITGLWSYSYANPNPQRTTTASGTIYRVQVGATKYLLPVNELREYEPIYYETMNGTDVKRFMVGNYADISYAEQVLGKLKAKGYTDAYIVTYKNGKRAGAAYTGSQNYVGTNNNQGNNNSNNIQYVNATNISSTKYLVYVIRLGTFATKKTSADLKNLSKIYYKNLNDGRIQYFVGPYYSYADATNTLPSIKQKGFNDAFVESYNNGVEMNISSAKELEAKIKGNQTVEANSDVVFRIQLGAYSDYLSNDEIESKFGNIKSTFGIFTHTSNGLVVYSTGTATSYSDAKQLRQNIASKGYSDCYIISFKNGKKVPLSSVIK